MADLPRLPYTEAVVTEALRVLPTVWLLGREAIEPTEVGGYRVPKGTTLWMSQWVIHRDPRWFDEPEAFRPERWADGLARRIPRYAYFPFGGGPRICIGKDLSLLEGSLLLEQLGREFRVHLTGNTPPEPWPTVTLRPKHEVPVRCEAR